MRKPKPKSGYGFHTEKRDWKRTSNDNWDIVMLSATDCRGAEYKGHRIIDGSPVAVWACKGAKGHITQTLVSLG